MIKLSLRRAFSAARKIALSLSVCGVLCGAAASEAFAITVTSPADSGLGSLREAITTANATPALDTIDFVGVTTIALLSPLPQITQPVFINGGSTPTVELNGLGAGDPALGLRISGGGSTVQGLIINRFSAGGIRIDTVGNNTIIGNRIGTNAAGTGALGNVNHGILIVGTSGNSIGNSTAAGRNLISGNGGNGITISAGGAATITGNYIGTNAAGDADLGNTQAGILIALSSNSVIGGTSATARNVISGNDGNGISIAADTNLPASNNSVLGNYIGTNAAGTARIFNTGSGVNIQAGGNTVGGTASGAGNVISGNTANGISISTNFSIGNSVFGNLIGTGANGTTDIGNIDNGIRLSNFASSNIIGGIGAGAGNTIAFNGEATNPMTSGRAGVYVDVTAGMGNALRANQIFANSGIGIDLGAVGSTANDANDTDMGPNNLQNAPVISGATTTGTIFYSLSSTPNTVFGVDFFSNNQDVVNGNDEARVYLGSAVATTNGSGVTGNLTFNSGMTLTATTQFITATATATGSSFGLNAPQAVGDSSEISAPVNVGTSTAAGASLGGKITTLQGRGIPNVTVVLRNTATGEIFRTKTDKLGDFEFADVPTGEDYVVTPILKGYRFNPANQFVNHSLERSDLRFGGSPSKSE